MKRTKIICTMGPASSKKNTLRAMMRAGMDIARFNFSHGSHEEHRGRVDMVKNLREELNIPVALLLDTKGPEIRTKLLKDHKKITLEAGSEFTLTTGDIEGDETRVAITYENLYKDVKKGGKILIDDGLIELEIENIKNGDIVCRVLNGGELGERKGINVPYVKVKLPGITEQDKDDILFGITHKRVVPFSFSTDPESVQKEQASCWLTYTNQELLLSVMQKRLKKSVSFWMKMADMILESLPKSRMPKVLKILMRSSRLQMVLWLPEVILVWRFLLVRFLISRK